MSQHSSYWVIYYVTVSVSCALAPGMTTTTANSVSLLSLWFFNKGAPHNYHIEWQWRHCRGAETLHDIQKRLTSGSVYISVTMWVKPKLSIFFGKLIFTFLVFHSLGQPLRASVCTVGVETCAARERMFSPGMDTDLSHSSFRDQLTSSR